MHIDTYGVADLNLYYFNTMWFRRPLGTKQAMEGVVNSFNTSVIPISITEYMPRKNLKISAVKHDMILHKTEYISAWNLYITFHLYHIPLVSRIYIPQ